MIQSIHNAYFDRFFVGSRVAQWTPSISIDPTRTPISNAVVASALCVDEADVQLFARYGLLARTCPIENSGQETIYWCNYWDIMQASACFSLIVVGMNAQHAFEFSEIFCDRLACLSEDTTKQLGVDIDTLIQITIDCLDPYLQYVEHSVSKYGFYSIAIKVGIDLINTGSRLAALLGSVAQSG